MCFGSVVQWSNFMFSDESKLVLDFDDRRQRVWCRAGKRHQPPAMIAHDAVEVGVSGSGEGSPWLGGQHSTSAGGVLLGSTTETIALSLFLCPTPFGMGMHSSSKTTMQESIMHVLSKITCSLAESLLSHSQRSTQSHLKLRRRKRRIDHVYKALFSNQR